MEETRVDAEMRYKGVRRRKWGRWVSEIRLPNSRERIWLGSYESAEKAARAFDAAYVCLRGRHENLNFPDMPPRIALGRTLTRQEIRAFAARHANYPNGNAEDVASSPPAVSEILTDACEAETSGVIDWSFMDLSSAPVAGSEMAFGGGMDYIGYDFWPAALPADEVEENGDGDLASNQLYLWNF